MLSILYRSVVFQGECWDSLSVRLTWFQREIKSGFLNLLKYLISIYSLHFAI